MLRNLLFTLALLILIPTLTSCSQPALAGEIDASKPELLASLQPVSAGILPSDISWNNPLWRSAYIDYLETEIAENHIPGLAVAVVQDQEIVLLRVFGLRDVAAGEPVTPDTLFHIGSTHTSMTAMMLATLVDDGYLDWGTPAVDILPDFELSDPEATKSVTIRHLLAMQGGVPSELSSELKAALAAEEKITPADLFELVAQKQLIGKPGERLHHSNLSTAIAGYLGVLAAGGDYHNLRDDYARLLQHKVLDPIGMETATIYATEARQSNDFSKSYTLSESGEPVLALSKDNDETPLAPAYSLKASINDMALYVNTQLNQGLAPNQNRVVSAVNLTETWQPNGENYGMGWEIEPYAGRQILLQRGAYDNFASVIGLIPELDTGIVILLNSDEAGAELIREAPYTLVNLLTQP